MQPLGKELFNTPKLQNYLDKIFSNMRDEIESTDADRLLNTSTTAMSAYLNDKYKVEPLSLNEGNIVVEQIEKDVDIKNPFGKTYKRRGTSNIFYVPFSGDSNLFKYRAYLFT